MRDLFNIDKSAYRAGEYVGYGDGVWRIARYGTGWQAVRQAEASERKTVRAGTLGEISELLAAAAVRNEAGRAVR